MANGDLFKYVLQYENQGVLCSAVFHYQQQGGGANAASQLASAVGFDLVPEIRDVMPDSVSLVRAEVINTRTPSDYSDGIYPPGTDGNRTSTTDLAPSFLAVQFTSSRPFPGTRSARKRFAFLFEDDIQGNLLSSTFVSLSQVVALEAALQATLSFGGTNFVPAVVKAGYRIGDPLRPAVLSYLITNYQLDPRVSTQNSRKD